MINPYAVHSWSTQYREERLQEARMTQLKRQLRENKRARSERGPVSLALANVLSLVRGA